MLINEIFHSIQGEGPYAGTPTIFIRTQGCDVGCSWCDTKKSWDRSEGRDYSIEDLKPLIPTDEFTHLCITGGEPLQADLTFLHELLAYAQAINCFTTIETSGITHDTYAAFNLLSKFSHVVLSPKAHAPFYEPLMQQVDCIKTVVTGPEDIDRAVLLKDRYGGGRTHYLQPRSNCKDLALLCVEACKKHKFRLSMQLHKILGVL